MLEFTPQGVTNVVWGLAALARYPGPELLDGAAAQAMQFLRTSNVPMQVPACSPNARQNAITSARKLDLIPEV